MWSIWKKALKFHILNSILKSKFKIEFAYFLVVYKKKGSIVKLNPIEK